MVICIYLELFVFSVRSSVKKLAPGLWDLIFFGIYAIYVRTCKLEANGVQIESESLNDGSQNSWHSIFLVSSLTLLFLKCVYVGLTNDTPKHDYTSTPKDDNVANNKDKTHQPPTARTRLQFSDRKRGHGNEESPPSNSKRLKNTKGMFP